MNPDPADPVAAADAQKAQKKRDEEMSEFVTRLAKYHGVQPEEFDAIPVPGGTLRSYLDFFEETSPFANSTSQPMRVQVSDVPDAIFEIQQGAVMTQKLLVDGDADRAMAIAIEMALAAMADPTLRGGVEVHGTDQEKAILAAAAKLVGLTVRNGPPADPQLDALAQRKLSELRHRIDQTNALANDEPDPAPQKGPDPEKTGKDNEPEDSSPDHVERGLPPHSDQKQSGKKPAPQPVAGEMPSDEEDTLQEDGNEEQSAADQEERADAAVDPEPQKVKDQKKKPAAKPVTPKDEPEITIEPPPAQSDHTTDTSEDNSDAIDAEIVDDPAPPQPVEEERSEAKPVKTPVTPVPKPTPTGNADSETKAPSQDSSDTLKETAQAPTSTPAKEEKAQVQPTVTPEDQRPAKKPPAAEAPSSPAVPLQENGTKETAQEEKKNSAAEAESATKTKPQAPSVEENPEENPANPAKATHPRVEVLPPDNDTPRQPAIPAQEENETVDVTPIPLNEEVKTGTNNGASGTAQEATPKNKNDSTPAPKTDGQPPLLLPDFTGSTQDTKPATNDIVPSTPDSSNIQQNVQVIVKPQIIVTQENPAQPEPVASPQPLTSQFAETQTPLPVPAEQKPETPDEILAAAGISRGLYEQVMARVIRDQLATAAHVENIIGAELVDRDGTQGIVNSTALAKTILKVLEIEGVVKQDRPGGKRIVVIPAGGDGGALRDVPPRERPFLPLQPQ